MNKNPTNDPVENKKRFPAKDYRPIDGKTWEQKLKEWGEPEAEMRYECEVQQSGTGLVRQELLKWSVEEDESQFVTADDGSEIDAWNWDIIKWVKAE